MVTTLEKPKAASVQPEPASGHGTITMPKDWVNKPRLIVPGRARPMHDPIVSRVNRLWHPRQWMEVPIGQLVKLPRKVKGVRVITIDAERLRRARGIPAHLDPRAIGFDGAVYEGLSQLRQETDVLDYASAGTDTIALTRSMFITHIDLVADPYQHDVTTATITPVQDAADKVLSGLSVAGGGPTYCSVSSTLAFLKALSALNKHQYGGNVPHEDLATAVAADHLSRQAWALHFGAMNDIFPWDISAGIPAESETSLALNATFGANNLIATTAANGTVDVATDIYAVVYGVTGLPAAYRTAAPRPNFQHHHSSAPATTTTFNLQTGRYLKRLTILNLAAVASNNEARNDANLTDVTLRFMQPEESNLFNQIRWQLFKSIMAMMNGRGPELDRDGALALVDADTGMDGVAVVDLRKFTGNPYGLNLTAFTENQVRLIFTVGTTTGSIHVLAEYYVIPNQDTLRRVNAWGGWQPS